MDEHKRTIYLLRKLISNTCIPEELRETKQLISEGIDDAIWMEVLNEHEKSFLTQPERTSSPQARQRLERIRASITAAGRTKQNKRNFFPTQIRWVAAAAASILIAILLLPQLRSFINSSVASGSTTSRVFYADGTFSEDSERFVSATNANMGEPYQTGTTVGMFSKNEGQAAGRWRIDGLLLMIERDGQRAVLLAFIMPHWDKENPGSDIWIDGDRWERQEAEE